VTIAAPIVTAIHHPVSATKPNSHALPYLTRRLTLPPQLLDLEPEGIVLGNLQCQEAPGERRLGGDTRRSEQVHVATLAQAHAEFVRHLTLGAARTRIEQTKDAKQGLISHRRHDGRRDMFNR